MPTHRSPSGTPVCARGRVLVLASRRETGAGDRRVRAARAMVAATHAHAHACLAALRSRHAVLLARCRAAEEQEQAWPASNTGGSPPRPGSGGRASDSADRQHPAVRGRVGLRGRGSAALVGLPAGLGCLSARRRSLARHKDAVALGRICRRQTPVTPALAQAQSEGASSPRSPPLDLPP
jgi:hypothetical protein